MQYQLVVTRPSTHTRLTAIWPGLPGSAGTRKVKPIWILLKQETVSGSGISWASRKSAPHSRPIATPAPHHSVFYRPDALPAAQPTASMHWRQNARNMTIGQLPWDVLKLTSAWITCIQTTNRYADKLNAWLSTAAWPTPINASVSWVSTSISPCKASCNIRRAANNNTLEQTILLPNTYSSTDFAKNRLRNTARFLQYQIQRTAVLTNTKVYATSNIHLHSPNATTTAILLLTLATKTTYYNNETAQQLMTTAEKTSED